MYNVGTIIELARDGAIVMVSDCEFLLIKKRKGMFIGQQVLFTDSDIKNPRQDFIKKAYALGGIAAMLIISIVIFLSLKPSTLEKTYAFVDIDINPSLELLIDRDNLVVGTKTINEDAEKLVTDINLTGIPVKDAILKVFELAHDFRYVDEERENRVLITLSLNSNTDKKGDEAQKLEYLEKFLNENLIKTEGANLKPVIISVSAKTKNTADNNNLSTGRQFIYEKAKEQDVEIDLKEAKESSIEELLDKVDLDLEEDLVTGDEINIPTPLPSTVPTPKSSSENTPTPVSTPKPTAAVTSTPTAKASVSPKPTAKPTIKNTPHASPKATPSKANYEYARISGKAEGGKITLKWQPVSNKNGFKHYKVVASKSSTSPQYPQNGYLYMITDINTTTAIIDNSTKYNNGDFGSYFKNGEKYYFSITTVYEGATVPGDVIVLTYSGQNVTTGSSPSPSSTSSTSNTTSSLTPKVTASVANGKVTLKWNPIYVEGFTYYKIVISKNNAKPKYPDDGYIYYTTNPNETTCTIDKTMSYSGGDIGGSLKSGEKYYFSVTLVYNGISVPGNAIQLTFP